MSEWAIADQNILTCQCKSSRRALVKWPVFIFPAETPLKISFKFMSLPFDTFAFWIHSTHTYKKHGQESSWLSCAYTYQELCSNQAQILFCRCWWQGQRSCKFTFWHVWVLAHQNLFYRLSICIGFYPKPKSLPDLLFYGVIKKSLVSPGKTSKKIG
jgi:hypothetical protein